MIISTE